VGAGRSFVLLGGAVLLAPIAIVLTSVDVRLAIKDENVFAVVVAVISAALGLGCLVGIRKVARWAREWSFVVGVGGGIGEVLQMSGCQVRHFEKIEPRLVLPLCAIHVVAAVLLWMASKRGATAA
jgi:hypothetical protein